MSERIKDISSCMTTARKEGTPLANSRVEQKEQMIRKLHANNHTIDSILLHVFGLSPVPPDDRPALLDRAINNLAEWTHKRARLTSYIEKVIAT